MVAAMLGGTSAQQILSTGLAALPANSDGVPFDCSHVYASGNLAADMYANVTAESTGRLLATRLYHFTDDPGMKDMLSFLMHATPCTRTSAGRDRRAGRRPAHPIPNSFPQEKENEAFTMPSSRPCATSRRRRRPAAGQRARPSTSGASSQLPASRARPCRASARPGPTPLARRSRRARWAGCSTRWAR